MKHPILTALIALACGAGVTAVSGATTPAQAAAYAAGVLFGVWVLVTATKARIARRRAS